MEEEKKLKKQGIVYSEAYYSRNTSRGATTKKFSKDKLKCFCRKTGHFKKDCFAKKKNGANIIEDHDEDQPLSEEASQEEANFVQNQSWGF